MEQLLDDVKNRISAWVLSLPYVCDGEYLPRESGIYFIEMNGRIVYVGQSVDIHKRWVQHKNGIRRELTGVIKIHYFTKLWETKGKKSFCEAFLILGLFPNLNRTVKINLRASLC